MVKPALLLMSSLEVRWPVRKLFVVIDARFDFAQSFLQL